MKRRYWWGIGVGILAVAAVLGVRACQSPSFNADFVSQDQQEALESGLTLEDVTLEQQGDNGELIWRVEAGEATYSPDRASAELLQVEGELFQAGELLYRVTADKGFIEEDGQVISLRENIVAVGVQNQMTLRGDDLAWRAEEAVMVLLGGVTGEHPQVRTTAQEARLYNRENRMELREQVVATTVVDNPQVDPWLKLQGNLVNWRWQDEELRSPQPLRIERFENEQITEVLTGGRGRVELASNQATVTEAVRVQISEVPLVVTSDSAVWQVDEERININQPVRIVNQKEKLILTAQQGRFDLEEQMVFLTRDVLVRGAENNSRLATNQLTWNLLDQTVLAQGAVDYRQGEPPLTVRGPRARGRIQEQTIVIDGGRVVTEIVPSVP